MARSVKAVDLDKVDPRIREFAQKVLDNSSLKFVPDDQYLLDVNGDEQRYGVAIMVILTIISIVVSLGRWLWECRTRRGIDVITGAKNPSMLAQVRVRHQVRKGLGDELFNKYGETLINSIFLTVKENDPTIIEDIIVACQSINIDG